MIRSHATYSLLAIATFFGLTATWLVRSFALRAGIVSHPNPLVRQHTRPVAYLGGLAIGLAVAASLMVVRLSDPGLAVPVSRILPQAVIIPSLLFLVIGIADDLRPFPAWQKFALQIIAAGVAVGLGARYRVTGWEPLDAAISGFWILVVVNAFNLTDVCDGLLGGLVVIQLLFLVQQDRADPVLALVAAGATLGFLVFNLPPATIFLGDAGSHLLGAWVVLLTMMPGSATGQWSDLLRIVLLLGVPLFELVFLLVVRYRKGVPWWRGSPDHFSLRLQEAGLTRLQTDLLAWTISVCLAAVGLLLGRFPLSAQLVLLLLMLGTGAWCGRLLLRLEVASP